MSLKLLANSNDPPLGALIAAEVINSEGKTKIETTLSNASNSSGNVQLIATDRTVLCESNNEVGRYLGRTVSLELYGGDDICERTEVDHWMSFSIGPLKSQKSLNDALNYLDNILMTKTWLVSKRLTLADIYVFSTLVDHCPLESDGNHGNISRWYKQMLALPSIQKVLASIPKNRVEGSGKATKSLGRQEGKDGKRPCGMGNRKQEGKFIELPGAEMGKVVVRFPPEASGYLHIGHAKAALLNQYYAEAFDGQLIMRFDDTNPAKENVEFEQAILQDLEMLQIKPDRFTHSSDYFDLMLSYCDKLINDGKAFVDDTPALAMKEQREQRLPSANRDNSVEKNMELWEEMKKGTTRGQECCVRAKIDYQSTNGCMRDPTIYRCKPEPHPRTGTKYKVYPTYDFACPIVDAVEGVTHTLRTTEYHDRDVQFYWLIEALELRRPHIWEYSRLNMTNTVLSKRRLTWLVAKGLVDGWDDPRFPTVRGILRRGMTVDGLKQFIIAQGSSRSVVFMEWDKIWSFNKKVIDPIASRYTALNDDETVEVIVEHANEAFLTVQNHPKDPTKGTKQVRVGSRVMIERCDAETLVEGQNATFINWGNLLIKSVKKENGAITGVVASLNLENKDYKNTVKLTWLAVNNDEATDTSEHNLLPCYAVYFEHIISKAVLGKDEDFKDFIARDTRREVKLLAESEMKRIKKGEIIQLQRKGFFRCDVPYAPVSPFTSREQPIVLFHIPDGHSTSQTTTSAPVNVENSKKNKKVDNNAENISSLHEKITAQGNRVRDVKAAKAEKSVIDGEVKILLGLKAEYKLIAGTDWKPEALGKTSLCKDSAIVTDDNLSRKIQEQGEKVRKLKTEKAEKTSIDQAITELLALKADYKKTTGKDWKPAEVVQTSQSSNLSPKIDEAALSNKVAQQGERVRKLKAEKAEKKAIDQEIKELLALKDEYKKTTGKDWKPAEVVQTSKSLELSQNDVVALSRKVAHQGERVRKLKAEKAEKKSIDQEVKELLALKAEYKKSTGKDWKPEEVVETSESLELSKIDGAALSSKVAQQGERVRQLKAEKADKKTIDLEVKSLLTLKTEYKSATGKDWKPEVVAEISTHQQAPRSTNGETLSEKIQQQGVKVRQLKSAKSDEKLVDQEVKALLALKAEYKEGVGEDWKPVAEIVVTKMSDKTMESSSVKIVQNGDKVHQLKMQIDEEVKNLLKLKSDYKSLAGKEWKPEPTSATTTTIDQTTKGNELSDEIIRAGDTVRRLKSEKAEKHAIDEALKILVDLKSNYKIATGQDWKAPGGTDGSMGARKEKNPAPPRSTEKVGKKGKTKEQRVSGKEPESNKTGTRLCMEAKKNENFSDWYPEVITKSEMIWYYDIAGCYIMRYWSKLIWKTIMGYMDHEIMKLGVQDTYFPMFVSRAMLEKEKDHIADFAPEVAWVTKSGESELAEPIAIRPTSETIVYPAFAKWLKSYRDLPLKVNQWCNVVRWEFKHPQPFLRAREFLWQEGHSAFATKAEADEEVLTILDLYATVYEDYLAVPVVKGRKTEKEKFAGADYTTTVEAFIPASGRAIQGATSHHLGQNFSKMFDIQVQGAGGGTENTFVYQNSWGFTTRSIGVMVMVHGDDKGLVLPPKIAPFQAVIVPCGITASTSLEQRQHLMDECKKLQVELEKNGDLRIKDDYRNEYSSGWKFCHWELKGVPVRIELGFKDLEKSQVTLVRRDSSERLTADRANIRESVDKLLEEIQKSMLSRATKDLKDHIKETNDWEIFCSELDKKNIILAPFCGDTSCENKIKVESTRDDAGEEPEAPSMGAKSLCIPFEQPKTPIASLKCVHPDCTRKPKFYCLFGRSY